LNGLAFTSIRGGPEQVTIGPPKAETHMLFWCSTARVRAGIRRDRANGCSHAPKDRLPPLQAGIDPFAGVGAAADLAQRRFVIELLKRKPGR
jgi:hypothetical protein